MFWMSRMVRRSCRRIPHWKTSARTGQLQTKVFEPAASQHLLIFLNGQTLERAYEGVMGDYFETAVMVAASLANAGLDARHPVGLFTNNSVRDASRRVRLPASRHASQMVRILETLAQMTHFTLMPLDQLLRLEAANLPFGASLIAVSAVANDALLTALLDLRSRAPGGPHRHRRARPSAGRCVAPRYPGVLCHRELDRA